MEVSIPHALSDGNLYEAWLKVKENGGCGGVDGETIAQFGRRLFINLDTLRNEVHYGTYRPQPLLRVIIDEAGRKPRPLSIPTVRDRVLQSAVARTLTPVLEAEFEDCSFAYRQGRSVDMAVRRVMRYRDEGYRWVVDADIQSFFDEIDHAQLLTLLRRWVSDAGLLDLVKSWLSMEVRDGDAIYRLRKGVPQGSPISPLLSNLYLDRLDEALTENGLRLVRYADDFLVLCKDETRAQQALELTEEVLAALKLRINEAKTRIVDFERGFRFLGVQFVRSLVMKTKSGDEVVPAIRPLKPVVAPDVPDDEPVALPPPFESALSDAFGEAVEEGRRGSVEAYMDSLPDFSEPAEPEEDERRRRRIADALENHGVRVQRSVFECHLSVAELEALTDELIAFLDEAQDHLRCYSLCPKDYPKVAVDGRGRVTEDPDYHVV